METGNIIMLCTSGTVEEKWLQSATESLNVDWIYCNSVDQLLKRL